MRCSSSSPAPPTPSTRTAPATLAAPARVTLRGIPGKPGSLNGTRVAGASWSDLDTPDDSVNGAGTWFAISTLGSGTWRAELTW